MPCSTPVVESHRQHRRCGAPAAAADGMLAVDLASSIFGSNVGALMIACHPEKALVAIAVLLATWGADVLAQTPPTPFDGAWSVVMTCSPHNAGGDDAKGYTHRFPAEVSNGRLRGTHGKEGEPGWHDLYGEINSDGGATLRLDGIVNNPKYAINDAQRGKVYSYRIKAQFDPSAGTGERLTGRTCEFKFAR